MTSPERRYTSLFIDLDNTLWDTIHDNKKCLEELFVDYQFDRHFASFEAFYALYLPYNERLWERYQNQEIDRRTLLQERMLHVLRPMGIRDTRLAMRLNRDLNERTTRHTTLIPGATELLEHVSRSYRLFVLSNGFHEVQSLKMERAGIARYFRGLILSERVGARKPNRPRQTPRRNRKPRCSRSPRLFPCIPQQRMMRRMPKRISKTPNPNPSRMPRCAKPNRRPMPK